MDVDKHSIVTLHVDHLGVEHTVRMPYDAKKMLHYVSHYLSDKRVAFVYEAGPTGFGLADDLLAAGYACMVVNPAQVPTARGQRVRTNRLDARKLAYQLRGGDLKGILVPSMKYRYLREYVTLRKMHINESVKCKQRIKALFLRYSLPWPGAKMDAPWSNALIKQLKTYACASALQFKLASLLEQADLLAGHGAPGSATDASVRGSRPGINGVRAVCHESARHRVDCRDVCDCPHWGLASVTDLQPDGEFCWAGANRGFDRRYVHTRLDHQGWRSGAAVIVDRSVVDGDQNRSGIGHLLPAALSQACQR